MGEDTKLTTEEFKRCELKLNVRAFFWLFFFSFVWVSVSSALTLEEALNASLETSRELASSREGWIAARESVFSSAGSGDFGLSFSGSGSVSRTDSGSGYKNSNTHSNKITLSKNLYDFGKVIQNTTLAEINLDRAYASYKETEQSVILETSNAYLNLIKARRELELKKNNRERLSAHVSAARVRVAEGTETPTGLAEAISRHSRARADEILAISSLENAEDLFQKLTGVDNKGMSKIFELPSLKQELPGSVSEAAMRAKENNPNVLIAVAAEKAASQTIVTMQTNQKPDISFSLSGTEGKASDSVSLSLSISSSLYDSQSTVASARKTVADHSKARIDLEEARSKAELEGRSAFRDWRAAVTALEAVKSEIEASQLAADGIRNEVKFGLKTALDLLDAEKNVKDAEIRLISAEHDQLIAELELGAAVGALTPKNLSLNYIYNDLNTLPRPENPLDSN